MKLELKQPGIATASTFEVSEDVTYATLLKSTKEPSIYSGIMVKLKDGGILLVGKDILETSIISIGS